MVVNMVTIEQEQKRRKAKNVILFGVKESSKENVDDMKKEDENCVFNVLKAIGKEDIKPTFIKRIKSKKLNIPGPILVELPNEADRNPVLASAKKLAKSEYKDVYISPDLTEAERLLEYELRTERNKLNQSLEQSSPFRYGIRNNQIIRINKNK